MAKAEPERHSMKGWGARFADWNEPRTLEEAQTMATLAIADRLLECSTSLEDLKLRLARIELWLETNVPSYRQSLHEHKPLAGVRIS